MLNIQSSLNYSHVLVTFLMNEGHLGQTNITQLTLITSQVVPSLLLSILSLMQSL